MSASNTLKPKVNREEGLIDTQYRDGYSTGYHDAMQQIVSHCEVYFQGTDGLSETQRFAAEQLREFTAVVSNAAHVPYPETDEDGADWEHGI